ncbi:MAG: RecX family transcriptional regulator [Alphaproteobacteria bacterium]|nr:RecX family transcriptional regulator [Alphaproteobacteria bacterium]
MSAIQDKAENDTIKKRKRPPRRISESYLHNAGLYYLQRFASSSAQFRRVMTRKIDRSIDHHGGPDREECMAMLDSLVETFLRAGLLNDEGYTRACVETFRRRGLSERAIVAKLSAKGIDAAMVRDALDPRGDDDLFAALRLARRRRAGPFATETARKDRYEKDLAAFGRAGFSYDVSRRVLRMEPGEAELILGGGLCPSS